MVRDKDTRVGFIGTGVMGKSMAGHILNAGYRVSVYNRTREKADELIKKGAVWAGSVAEIAAASDVIITMIGFPKDVEEVYFGKGGLLENSIKGTYLIDMTTSTPSLAVKIYSEAFARGLYSLDAPVSGGDIGARDAKLVIMAGGDRKVFDELHPIFDLLGRKVGYMGKAGAGQYAKMSNQIAIASTMTSVCECLAYAKKAGLDPYAVIDTIQTGSAGSWSLSNYGPRILKGDFNPGFYVKHFIKDLGIALQSADEMNIKLPALELVKSLYDKLAAEGLSDFGTQVLFKLYEL